MSLVSPKTMDRACNAGKADQPCNITDDNLASDCYESMHAFKKIRSPSTSGLRKSPNKWTKEENQKLAALVSSYGEKKWKRISAEMGGQKTGAQCAQHWKRVLSPEIRKGHWDENEEDLLLRLVNQYGSCWKKIAKKIPQRTDIQCRYQYLKAKQSREVSWDTKEDDSLIKKVMEMANCNFLQLHDSSPERNSPSPSGSSLRGSTGYSSTGSSGSCSSVNVSNKENDSRSGSSGSEKEDARMDYSPDCGRSEHNTSMCGSPSDVGGSSWRSSKEAPISLSGTCTHCLKPVSSHVSKVVWLEISEHMARLKLTSTLRTALECKTRFNDLLGNKFSLFGNSSFTSGSAEGSKHFDMKFGAHGDGFGNSSQSGSGTENMNAFHSSSENIGVKINHNKSKPIPIPNGCNTNNINLNNCNNNNITINITNSFTTSTTNTAATFPQIASLLDSNPMKSEHIHAHMLPKNPILSAAPSFPSFPHLSRPSFPHLPQPNTPVKPTSLRAGGVINVPSVGGLESLAAVASILPREMLADMFN